MTGQVRSALSRTGFTLIELSIVLVIIGLIVGGVLVGRDLIHAAEIRSQIRQIQSYETAANTFRVKYDAIPGDMKNASQFWSTAVNGDGDGTIDTADKTDYDHGVQWSNSTEYQGFFFS